MTTLSDSCPTSVTARNGNQNNELQSPIASSKAKSSIETFSEIFFSHQGRRVDKWRHYFPLYDRHLGPYRKACRVLEIGIDHGGSLQLWKRFFPHAQIVGIDINPACAEYIEDRIEVRIGNQADPQFLASLGSFDIVIDDGSHESVDQEASIKALWPKTKCAYFIEDCHYRYPTPPTDALIATYPWVMVLEKPIRCIRGYPSRPLRQDEIDAQHLHPHV